MTANELYTYVFNRLTNGWAEVWAFREVAEAGIPAAVGKIAQQKRKAAHYLTGREEWPQMLKDPVKFHEMGGVDGLAAKMTEMSMQSATAAVDAASLVFAHSIVDGAAAGFLQAISLAAPADWQQFVDNRKWTVAEVRKFGYDRLFTDVLMKELEHIERNSSLPEKGMRIRQLCRPERDWELPMQYDERELERIDRLRHDVVHGDRLGETMATIKSDLVFLENLGWYFFALLHKRYGMKLEIQT